ncbi:hypothetical protein BDV25DRAFT_135397 [Aspergillus avenaceus]|uniref:Ribosomal RNA methyltransferase FtsJ domain-containing protein n=1 Tax=Aspergillus avenaceus TaxID=36643 RepID=A0A5N6U8X4_ASPAV|nr:hypothetical protein BDV25DRAFT_135397 [Aspergillus avenaceus]
MAQPEDKAEEISTAPDPQVSESQEQCPHDEWYHSTKTIVKYLMEHVPEFKKLSQLREAGWKSAEGDAFFQKQRQTADNPSEHTIRFFHEMMLRMAGDLHKATSAFQIQESSPEPRILDMCMAPGGFLEFAMRVSPNATGLGFTLPPSQGGHKVRISDTLGAVVRYLDITMLAADMGVDDIPVNHPDAQNFLPRLLSPGDTFDLIICDGQVLRTHERAEYRFRREAIRLTMTQLALGLEHLRPGGSMVVLLHKLEAWDTVQLLYMFRKFSSVKLFKSRKSHAKRSSFYMVASDIRSRHPDALGAVEMWKGLWRVATFGSDEDYAAAFADRGLDVRVVLEEFGAELVRLGRLIWDTQAKALETAPFLRTGGRRGRG